MSTTPEVQPSPIQVTHLRGVVLSTPALAASDRFYRDVWGLQSVGAEVPGRSYWRGRSAEPWGLGLVEGPRRELLRLRLGLADRAAVDAAYSALLARGCEVLAKPTLLAGPGEYYGLVVRDPDGVAIELSATTGPAQEAPGEGPLRVSHLVLNSPQARRTTAFYTDVLGFTVSDWYEHDAIIFLRCNNDHHCVGISQSHPARRPSLNHVAFLLDDDAGMRRATQRAIALGGEPIWGPGRHGPGGNAFCYFRDPSDWVVEYTAELIQIAPGQDWHARQWPRTPQNANVLGTGGPTPVAIQLMGGEEG